MTRSNMAGIPSEGTTSRLKAPATFTRHSSQVQSTRTPRHREVLRTNTLSGVTDEARRVLEELLNRHTNNFQVSRASPSVLPEPVGQDVFDASSPISDDEPLGGKKRPPSNGASTILGDSSPSPQDDRIPENLINRKKKTFIARTKERLRESIRRQQKKPLTPSDEHLLEPVTPSKKKKNWFHTFKSKKHKKTKEQKENVETVGARGKYMIERGLDGRFRESFEVDHESAKDRKKVQRPHSADETRLRPLGPRDEDLLNTYSTSTKKYRSSDSTPAVLYTSASLPRGARETENRQDGSHSLRRDLHLEGLAINYPRAPLAIPEDSRLSSDDEYDDIDGQDYVGVAPQSFFHRPLVHGTQKTFGEKSEEEKNELFSVIADQLDSIGDNLYLDKSTGSRMRPQKGDPDAPRVPGNVPDLRHSALRGSTSSLGNMASDLIQNTTYDQFQQTVTRVIGSEPGLEQIAAMFRMTKCAVHLAGVGTAAAGRIKESAIRYFADHFASWIVEEGGWESVAEDATDMELD